ncbi:MAG: 30S ribosome-binding factor RbfA [Candidatus Omnitrophota bacterium]|jgi:ribosome-binding factor A
MGRMEKVNELVKRQIGVLLQKEMHDPRLQFVTITEVHVSPDLHYAQIKFSVLGSQCNTDDAVRSLNHAAGYLRRRIGQNLTLRYTPELEFIYDPSIEYSARVEQTLQDIKKLPKHAATDDTETQDQGAAGGA